MYNFSKISVYRIDTMKLQFRILGYDENNNTEIDTARYQFRFRFVFIPTISDTIYSKLNSNGIGIRILSVLAYEMNVTPEIFDICR